MHTQVDIGLSFFKFFAIAGAQILRVIVGPVAWTLRAARLRCQLVCCTSTAARKIVVITLTRRCDRHATQAEK
jgi:hypothetical protein